MASWSPNHKSFLGRHTDQTFCCIRREWVAATPEEMVRQRFLLKLTQQLGFPLGQIAVEVPLRQLPHLGVHDLRKIPARRADILCYAQTFQPLLLVECKAVALTPQVIRQTIGYNQYVQARYVAIVNQESEQIGWLDPESRQYQFREGIPNYQQLIL